jgi:hypothetical protein
MLPFLVPTGITPAILVGVQVGYCICDIAAKCGYGLMIYSIARAKENASAPVAARVSAD